MAGKDNRAKINERNGELGDPWRSLAISFLRCSP
jgi:hypothetical protein